MENKKFELNDAQLDDVSGGFLAGPQNLPPQRQSVG